MCSDKKERREACTWRADVFVVHRCTILRSYNDKYASKDPGIARDEHVG